MTGNKNQQHYAAIQKTFCYHFVMVKKPKTKSVVVGASMTPDEFVYFQDRMKSVDLTRSQLIRQVLREAGYLPKKVKA